LDRKEPPHNERIESMSDTSKSGSFVRSVVATNLFLRKRLWIWPVVAVVLLAVFGWWVRSLVEDGTKQKMAADLQTILDADVAALRIWLCFEEARTQAIAADSHVRGLVKELVELGSPADGSPAELLQSEPLRRMRAEMGPWLEAGGY
jgi:hypothetical protein